ncbi:MAG TPA: TonB-dependent receptor plug domain-containing protein, partial [Chitinophagales bacterium]|nr:TonB-dependent receptor plug domain-containing protein [Chitinophagales bacterium]
MKNHFLYILFAFAFTLNLNAQNGQGVVTDAFTNKPIAGVVITNDKSNASLATDSAGKFELSCADIPYYITLHFLGYEDVHIKVTSCNRSINAQMSPSSLQLNEVQINGWANDNKNNQLYRAQSIGVLSRADLNRGTGLSLVDAIDLVPGVNMMARSPFGGQHIVIRGYYGGGSGANSLPAFNTNGLGYQVTLNNIPLTDATGTTLMDDIDFSTLGKVEVIKGPQSTLYGSGIGGVVNLYTARPTPNTTEISQTAMGGSYGLWRTTTGLTTAGSNYDVALNYGHQNYNGFRPHDASRKDYVTFTGNYYGKVQTLSAYFSYSHSYEELAGEQDAGELYRHSDSIIVPTYVTNNSHTLVESFRGGVTDDFKFSKHFSNQTTVFGSGRSSNMPFAKGVTDYSLINFGARTGFVYDQQFKNVGIHGIIGGSVIRTAQTVSGNSFGNANNAKYTALNGSVFTQWNINLPLQ